MKVNDFEVINPIIDIILFLILMRKRDPMTLMLVLFTYGTMHFSFATIALISNDSAKLLVTMHQEGGGILAKLSAILCVVGVYILLGKYAFLRLKSNKLSLNAKKILFFTIFLMGALICGYFLNIRQGDSLQLKNVFSIEALLTLLLFGFLSLEENKLLTHFGFNINKWFLGGVFILFLADCLSFYEVFWRHAWAWTHESSGQNVYRASFTLFNPNLLAFWASLIYIGCAYAMHTQMKYRKIMMLSMILASVTIFFSGSRSVGLLLLGMLVILPLLLRKRFYWFPLMIFFSVILTIYTTSALLFKIFMRGNDGWSSIFFLGQRLITTPLDLYNYAIWMIANKLHHLPFELSFEVKGLPSELKESINGRLSGAVPDSGWLVLYRDVGWIGTIPMLIACLMIFFWAARIYAANRSIESVYALIIFLFCILIGFVMRIQIFAVWLFISIFLVPCLVLWSKTLDKKVRVKNKEFLSREKAFERSS